MIEIGKAAPSHTHKVGDLCEKLWGGFSRSALRQLEDLKRSERAPIQERSEAAWQLARWHAFQQNFDLALECVEFMRKLDPTKRPTKGQVLVEVDCLLHVGDAASARARLDVALESGRDSIDFFLAYANTYASLKGSGSTSEDAIRLNWINRVYQKYGLSSLIKSDRRSSLAIDNLRAAETLVSYHGPKVSIIVPAYSAENTLAFALRSLLAQTWRNLEIIVIDDCSPDQTFLIAEEFQQLDAQSLIDTSAPPSGRLRCEKFGIGFSNRRFHHYARC